ncbi:hypothetical protein PR048_005800 [Dryococelus australis]|uniref:Uncharacterized protein n=1 Tax=Dryococelus australis TaxID=614101 RepID=A0ABQ9IAB1_9NEOP|nr:hypothetical protein PR048_005800 [Dryococelus australis]
MNSNTFIKLCETQLLPNIPSPSIIVIDILPYHSMCENKLLTISPTITNMRNWLVNNVIFSADERKSELLENVRLNLLPPIYTIDKLFTSKRHTIIRLPPYHCELNPISCEEIPLVTLNLHSSSSSSSSSRSGSESNSASDVTEAKRTHDGNTSGVEEPTIQRICLRESVIAKEARRVVKETNENNEPSSIPGRVASGFSHVRFLPDDTAARWIFSGFSRFPRTCIPALLHNLLPPPLTALKTTMLRARISSLHYYLCAETWKIREFSDLQARLYILMYKYADINCTLVVAVTVEGDNWTTFSRRCQTPCGPMVRLILMHVFGILACPKMNPRILQVSTYVLSIVALQVAEEYSPWKRLGLQLVEASLPQKCHQSALFIRPRAAPGRLAPRVNCFAGFINTLPHLHDNGAGRRPQSTPLIPSRLRKSFFCPSPTGRCVVAKTRDIHCDENTTRQFRALCLVATVYLKREDVSTLSLLQLSTSNAEKHLQDKIGVKHVHTEVASSIGSQFIRQALDDSANSRLSRKQVANPILPGACKPKRPEQCYVRHCCRRRKISRSLINYVHEVAFNIPRARGVEEGGWRGFGERVCKGGGGCGSLWSPEPRSETKLPELIKTPADKGQQTPPIG